MLFYLFEQNNGDHELKGEKYVIIQAESALEANMMAMLNDVYFDGVDKNGLKDCPVCGYRWIKADDSSGCVSPTIHGMNPASCKDSWVIIKNDGTKYYNMEDFEYSNQEKISDKERFASEKERNEALARLMD